MSGTAEQVYQTYIEARSFACKACGYESTNRKVMEQHLRSNHRDLFDVPPPLPGITVAAGAGLSAAAPAASPAPEMVATSPLSAAQAGKADRAGNVQPAPTVRGAAPPSATTGPVVLYTDAGTWHNGTPRQRSVLCVWDTRINAVAVHEELPGTTNNEAEYAAIIAALELARGDRLRAVQIRSDSQLCVQQIKGLWQVKEERLRPLRDRAARLLKELGGHIEWVPRERNQAGIYLENRYKKGT